MAVYKVIQDIEAEDRLIGFLTLKGFVYAAIALFLGYINFRLVILTELGVLRWLFVFILSLPMFLFGLLATPLGGIQSTEDWLIARLRYFIKSKRRVWDQSGLKDLVTITAPKRIEKRFTDGLSQSEVKSRLQALASTLDSRGWAVKNVNVNLYTGPTAASIDNATDRLVGSGSLPQAVPSIDVRAEDDILDASRNAKAHHVAEMVQEKQIEYKQELMRKLEEARKVAAEMPETKVTQQPQPGSWFARQAPKPPKPPAYLGQAAVPGIPPNPATPPAPVSQQPTTPPVAAVPPPIDPQEEQALLEEIHHNQEIDQEMKARMSSHMKTVLPLSQQPAVLPPPISGPAIAPPASITAPPKPASQPVTSVARDPAGQAQPASSVSDDGFKPDADLPPAATEPAEEPAQNGVHQAAILDLAENRGLNKEISVATLSKEAQRKLKQVQVNEDGEVVISLH